MPCQDDAPGQHTQKVSGWHVVSWYLPLLTLATFSAGTQLALDFTSSPSMVLSVLQLHSGSDMA